MVLGELTDPGLDAIIDMYLLAAGLAGNALSTNTTHCSPRLACVAMPC